MNLLKRLAVVSLAAGFFAVVGVPAVIAQEKEARGSVSAVSASSLTVQTGGQSMTFVVDSTTLVEANGAGKRSRAAETAAKQGSAIPAPIKVTDYVKTGGAVRVGYKEVNGKNHASWVRPVASPGSEGGSTLDDSKVAQGTVNSVLGNKLMLDLDGREQTFVIADNTDVLARGAGKATKKAGGSLPLGDLIQKGDLVRVSYRDVNGAMTVYEIQIKGKATIAAK